MTKPNKKKFKPLNKLDFDDKPSAFPEVWIAEEETIELEINPIINKHVCLALKEYINDGGCILIGSYDPKSDVTVTFHAEHFEKMEKLEELIEGHVEMDFMDGEGEIDRVIESFKRCIEKLEKYRDDKIISSKSPTPTQSKGQSQEPS